MKFNLYLSLTTLSFILSTSVSNSQARTIEKFEYRGLNMMRLDQDKRESTLPLSQDSLKRDSMVIRKFGEAVLRVRHKSNSTSKGGDDDDDCSDEDEDKVEETERKKEEEKDDDCEEEIKVNDNSKVKDGKSKSDESTNSTSNDVDSKTSHTTNLSTAQSSGKSDSSSKGEGKGLIGQSFSGQCSDPHATESEPNGSEEFLNCGVETKGGWNPPMVKLSDLKMLSLEEVEKSSLFKPCTKYLPIFKQASKTHDVPLTLLVSFAMQESGCNANTGAGTSEEQGLMQLTMDKCGKRSAEACRDPTFNINEGAKYFVQTLKDSDDNFLLALGSYNGWQKGMTHASAVKAKAEGHCHWQNNLDYLYQMTGGWLLGLDGYSKGKDQNLAGCPGN